MSWRMNLWPVQTEWADVDVVRHASLRDAIVRFSDCGGPLRVFGSRGLILRAISEWDDAWECGDAHLPPTESCFIVQDKPSGQILEYINPAEVLDPKNSI